MIMPATSEVTPMESCCTEELMLMKPPRYRASTTAVIIAMAGTKRFDMHTINSVETAMATGNETRGRFVISRIGTVVVSEVMVNTFNFPARSAQRPTQFMLKNV